ncbi:MAG TPA: amino acid ABC transporter permease [Hyphomicrobiaceae bacterium]|nr:amino acid ABC transporter permease [Hyphomicrobiaceae bacterium]
MAVITGEEGRTRAQQARAPFFYRPEVRQVIYQVVLVVVLVGLFYALIDNTAANLRKQNIASGFGFVDRTAGFDISQTLIDYNSSMTYGRAFLVGLVNTLVVAGLGIVAATVLGFVIGIARLSHNWLIARLATVYVEVIRNIPLLLQLFFWYFAVLKALPPPRQSLTVPGGGFLNVRGLYLPSPVPEAGFEVVLATILIGVAASLAVGLWARWRQRLTGQQFPVFWTSLALIVALPLLVHVLLGSPLAFEYPELKGFNFQGGMVLQPEFLALLLGLSVYTASFIAEIVRAGIQGVSKGQKEAALAIGLTQGQSLRLVVIPQAMRIIIPPLTSQFLNLTKNSSLAVAIGYPDLVSVWSGTVLNQTGQAVEVILVTMGVFLSISLITSAFMNWFNRRMALVER